ncbi:MAG: phosphoesterase [Bacteroidetes bacterium]|nr:phosphoesterase [Bacteroidota bacterium]
MNSKFGFLSIVVLFPVFVFSQKASSKKLPFEDSVLQSNAHFTVMPYNRLVRSAGKVITYGDSSQENHTLDLSLLPDKKNIVVEDRYGIAIVDLAKNTILARWSFDHDKAWRNLMSTYSGITSFVYNNSTYIVWGAGGRGGDKSAIMLAQWDGKNIHAIDAIYLEKLPPAGKALPNQIIANTEDGVLYLYAVLNGNNQLVKIKFDDKKIIWSSPTGVAPYGLAIINGKAYVTNWATPLVTDTTQENAGTPWGAAYTNPATGGTKPGSLSIIDISNGKLLNELPLGIHPNAIAKSADNHFLYIANGNSDFITVVNVDKEAIADSINVGLFTEQYGYYGSSPNGLMADADGKTLYVANGMDNAIAVVKLGKGSSSKGVGSNKVIGYIPTETYPSGIARVGHNLYVTNLEAKGARVLSRTNEFKKYKRTLGKTLQAYQIHQQLASLSIIPLPSPAQLNRYTAEVKKLNLYNRTAMAFGMPRKNIAPKPLPERIGEPSVFKHVLYIIKENKTYDQVFGDIPKGRGNEDFCIYGKKVTPNQHQLANDFCLMDNYYASGKSSAEGHQWANAGMVSDYIEKSVRAWFRSYPHRQDDAMVYNKNGFIWNHALDHGKTVRVFGEACLTHYDEKMKWADIYEKYINHEPIECYNTTTISRLRPIISSNYPDNDNLDFPDQMRADVFIEEFKKMEENNTMPDLMVLSLPNNHTAGMSPRYPTPEAMVADNDLALGRIVEAITHSKYWDSTVIFVTEDDSQSGWDHISSYRTVAQVISPYSKLGKVVHTNYNQTSIVRTMEQILGIPPMTVIDATALPLFDCFGNKKQDYRYQLLANNIPLDEMNKPIAVLKGKAKYFAQLSATKAFNEVDGGNDKIMNQILWFNAKGERKYPSTR